MPDPPVRIPFARPSIGEDEIAEVAATLRSGWLASGPRVAELEERFRGTCGARFAVATGSGTAALHIALTALDVRGGEVLLPTMTFAATALAAVHAGARPVLVDVDEETLNIDPVEVERRIAAQTRAIVAVHYAGLAAPVDELLGIAKGSGTRLVEDAAHALGCSSRGRPAGSIGDVAAFSFNATKNITTIDGGMLTTSLEEVAARARPLRHQGMSRDAWDRDGQYEIVAAGFKYGMSDVHAALGLRQLEKLAGWQARRAALARRYREGLADAGGVRPLADAPAGSTHGNHLFVVRVDAATGGRDRLQQRLREAGIETHVHYRPLHLHPYFQRELGHREGDFPRAERAAREILSLPMHQALGDGDVDQVVDRIHAFVKR